MVATRTSSVPGCWSSNDASSSSAGGAKGSRSEPRMRRRAEISVAYEVEPGKLEASRADPAAEAGGGAGCEGWEREAEAGDPAKGEDPAAEAGGGAKGAEGEEGE